MLFLSLSACDAATGRTGKPEIRQSGDADVKVFLHTGVAAASGGLMSQQSLCFHYPISAEAMASDGCA
jgi:hypothetical protein